MSILCFVYYMFTYYSVFKVLARYTLFYLHCHLKHQAGPLVGSYNCANNIKMYSIFAVDTLINLVATDNID